MIYETWVDEAWALTIGASINPPCAPCPICGAPYGFHDDEPHAAACERIPAHLKHPGHKVARRAARDERRVAYEAYLRRIEG